MKKLYFFFLFLIIGIQSQSQSNALDFDGKDDQLVAATPLSSFSEFTIQIWFKGENGSNNRITNLMAWGDITTGFPHRFHIVTTNNKIAILDDASTNGLSYLFPLTSIVDDDNEWHHLTIVKKEDEIRLYLDDELGTYPTERFHDFILDPQFIIGRRVGDRSPAWNGLVDEFRMWDYAMPEADIIATRDCELEGNEAGLVQYFKFDQVISGGGVDIIQDATPGNRDAVLNNFALTGNSSNVVMINNPVNGPCTGCSAGFEATREPCSNTYSFSANDTKPNTSYSWVVTKSATGVTNNFSTDTFDFAFDFRAAPGQSSGYEVCLTVTNSDGCTDTQCDNFDLQISDRIYYEILTIPQDITVTSDEVNCNAIVAPQFVQLFTCPRSVITQSHSRSDGLEMSDPYEIGETVVTVIIDEPTETLVTEVYLYSVVVLESTECIEPAIWECGDAVITCASPINNSNIVAAIERTGDLLGLQYDTPLPYTTTHTWTLDQFGEVFGNTFDKHGNIYFASTSVYGPSSFGVNGVNIYKVDNQGNFDPTFNVDFPNDIGPARNSINSNLQNLPGLGNICYDEHHEQLLVTNFEDGKIYRIDPVTGDVIGSAFSPTNYLDITPGFAPLGDRVWGIDSYGNDANNVVVYYSIWNNDLLASNGTKNLIGSVQLDSNGDFIVSTVNNNLIEIPFLENINAGTISNYSNPVSDITLSSDGSKILVAEKTMNGDMQERLQRVTSFAHGGRVMEFSFDSNAWNPIPIRYGIGQGNAANSTGGVDYGFVNNDFSSCERGIWTLGDYLHGDSELIYGIQLINTSVGTDLAASYLFRLSGAGNAKSLFGDIEVYKCDVECEPLSDCFTVQNETITCVDHRTYDITLQIKNENDQVFDRLLTFAQNNQTAVNPTISIDFGDNMPILSPGETSGDISFQVRRLGLVDEEIEVCFDVIPQNPLGDDCCKDDFCLTLPVCCVPDQSKDLLLTQDAEDECCYNIEITNACAVDYFNGVTVSAIGSELSIANSSSDNNWQNQPQNDGSVYFDIDINGDGQSDQVPIYDDYVLIGNICLDGVTVENQEEQALAIGWFAENNLTETICRDTISTTCPPEPCNLISAPNVTCDNNDNYQLEFTVDFSASETTTANVIVINPKGNTQVSNYSPQSFSDITFAPGTSQTFTIDLHDLSAFEDFQFSVTMHDFDTPLDDGTYWCCEGEVISVQMPSCGIQGEPSAIAFQVVPNPVEDLFTVRFDQVTSTPMDIELITLQGELLDTRQVPAGSDSYSLSMRNALPAVYFIKVQDANGQVNYQKILKL